VSQDRTEKATSRRRQRAKDEGQFAYSQEVTGALTLFACLGVMFYGGLSPARFRAFFESALNVAMSAESDVAFTALVRESGTYFLMTAAPVFAAAVLAALTGSVLQGLPLVSKEAFSPKWDRLNPIAGFSKLKGRISPIEWAKILFLVIVSAAVLWSTMQLFLPQIAATPAMPLETSTDLLRTIFLRIITYIGVAITVLASADFFIQRWRFEEGIKQTKAEVKEDNKALEGNPLIKGKIRAIQRESARRRMMDRVKDANVIVTNPTHYAVALEYRPESMTAPRVIAKGRGWIAQKIKEKGREHDIPTVENVPLARALYRSVSVDQEIPAELYKAVAEVLAFVFRVRKGL
jgi:flagellar biosynthesis protein FlhB